MVAVVALLGCIQGFLNEQRSLGRVFAKHSNWAHVVVVEVWVPARGTEEDVIM
jgi:hypothetical protein